MWNILLLAASLSAGAIAMNIVRPDDVIARLNHGMVAMPIESISLILDSWLSTFEIKLPR
jgi:hypothetical protein